jgi:hypothetical protein
MLPRRAVSAEAALVVTTRPNKPVRMKLSCLSQLSAIHPRNPFLAQSTVFVKRVGRTLHAIHPRSLTVRCHDPAAGLGDAR